jgi:phosphoribosylglycinamide formyltransferase-1
MSEKKIIFLASGNGGHLKFVYHTITLLDLKCRIINVVCDRDCGAYQFALKENIPATIITYNKNNTNQLKHILAISDADIVITNIHKILDAETLKATKAKFINLHYSLLPAYKGFIGMKTLDAAQENNTLFVGATCHEVIEEVDAGRILAQCVIAVNWECESKDYISNIIFRGANLILLNSIITNLNITYDDFLVDELLIKNKRVFFSPQIKIRRSQFDEKFWSKLV